MLEDKVNAVTIFLYDYTGHAQQVFVLLGQSLCHEALMFIGDKVWKLARVQKMANSMNCQETARRYFWKTNFNLKSGVEYSSG